MEETYLSAKKSEVHGVLQRLFQELHETSDGEVRENPGFSPRGLQMSPSPAYRGGPTDLCLIPTGGRRDSICTGKEDVVHSGTYSADGIPCLQKNRALLP